MGPKSSILGDFLRRGSQRRGASPTLRILHRVAEHLQERGLQEGVELGEGLAALGPQRVRRIQDLRDALLFGEGREGNFEDAL